MKETNNATSTSAAAPAEVTAEASASAEKSGLSGNIGTFQLTMTVLALSAPLATVAGVSPLMLSYGGASAPIIFLIVTIGLIFFSVGFAKMGTVMTNPGGFYAFSTAGLGKSPGLGVAFIACVGYPLIGFYGTFFFPIALVDYVKSFGGPELTWWIISLIYIAVIVFISVLGVSLSVAVMSIIMVLECAVVIALDIACFIHDPGAGSGGSALTMPHLADPSTHAGLSMLYIFSTFMGFESTVIYREEVRTPDKTIPHSTMTSVIFIGCFYAVATWAFISCYGSNNIQQIATDNVGYLMQDTYKMLFGRIFMDIVTLMLLVSTFASTMSAINVSARYWYSLGVDGVLPKIFGKAHPKHHSPYIGLLGVGILYAVVITSLGIAGVDPVFIYPKINGIGTFTVMLTMFIAALSIIGYFRRNPIGKDQGGNVWNTLIAPIVGAVALGLFLYFAVINYSELTGGSSTLTAVGLGITAALFIGGMIYARVLRKKKPDVYEKIGRSKE